MTIKVYQIILNASGVIQSYADKTPYVVSNLNFDYEICDNEIIKGNDLSLTVLEDFFPGVFTNIAALLTYIGTGSTRFYYYLAVEIDGTIRFAYRFKSAEYDYEEKTFKAEFESIESVFVEFAKGYYIGGSATSGQIGYALNESYVEVDSLYYDSGYINNRYAFHMGEFIRHFAGKNMYTININSVNSDVLHEFDDDKEDDYHFLIWRGDSYDLSTESLADVIEYTFDNDGTNDFSMTLFDIIKIALIGWNGIISLTPNFTLGVGNDFEFDFNFYTRTNSPNKTALNLSLIKQKLKAYKEKVDSILITGGNFYASMMHNVFVKWGKEIDISVAINEPDSPIVADSYDLFWAKATFETLTGGYSIPRYGLGTPNYGWNDTELYKWYGQIVSSAWWVGTYGDGHVLEGECIYNENIDFFEELVVEGERFIINSISITEDGTIEFTALKK